MPEYKWSTPMEWLIEAFENGIVTDSDLMQFIQATADNDQIQDHFQSDMYADGFFTPLDQVDGEVEETDEEDEDES